MSRLCEGRVAIVTGAGRGIGREHALSLAFHGAKVVVNDLGGNVDGSGGDLSPAEQVVQEIIALGGEAVANGDSVSSWEGAQRLINTAIETFGDLHVRGPWIASAYYNTPDDDKKFTEDGWFRTGDIVTIDEKGYIEIKDRTKDVIKSGGEWISSVALEGTLMGHPAVAEAAVIAIADAKWTERPLACVVLKEGKQATPEELNKFLEPHFAKFWLPDAYEFVKEIPKTSVGKFKKSALREMFKNYQKP